MSDKEFISGLIVKAPHENAPEYVKAKLSIRREELIAWLQTKDSEWVNADVKVSQGGKWYAQVDNWKPNGNGTPRQSSRATERPARATDEPADDFDDSNIPFATNLGRF